MSQLNLVTKLKLRIIGSLIKKIRSKGIYPFIYLSYLHSMFHKGNLDINNTSYFSARPNPGAGIGHQMANWIAGYWYAKKFGLKFAHIPFSTKEWDDFLGFGENEKKVLGLKKEGYKVRKLPFFRENNEKEKELISKIIQSYAGEKVVFIAEQDQPYSEQYGVMDELKLKFRNSFARNKDKLIYNSNNFNIAVHIRRGDIVIGNENKNHNLIIRWLNNSYYEKILINIINNLKTAKPKNIYIFSQGERKYFSEFDKFENVHYCLDMNPIESFLHMVYADLLVTSKSSFSYKPALLSNSIKICPRNFWHGYPDKDDWILAEDDGSFDIAKLKLTRVQES